MAVRARWIIASVLLVMFVGVFIIGAAVWLVLREPQVSGGSWLVVDLYGPVPEDIPAHGNNPFLFEEPMTLWDYVSSIHAAAEDEDIAAMVVKIRSPGWGWGQREELRDALLQFRKADKPIYAWMESGDDPDYFVASACDSLFVPSGTTVSVDGLASYTTFLRGTLEWLGIEAEFEHVGQYKSGVETYTRRTMSEPSREAENALLDDRFEQYLQVTAESRGWSSEELRRLIDRGPYSSEEAVAKGLFDEILFESELDDRVMWRYTGEPVAIEDYASVATDGWPGTPTIAIVFASGTIVRGESGFDPLWGRTLGHETLIESIGEAAENQDVGAIILRIDSPGGDTYASRSMWEAVRSASRQKPIIASFSDLAASGGYYMAMGADTLVAHPGSITGSIGIYGGKFNLTGLYEKFGVNVEVLSRGKNAEMFSSLRGFTREEREKYLAQLWQDYTQFVAAVAENRDRPEEEIEPFAQGRVWSGNQAYEIGLVDELGGFETAIDLARRRAGYAPDEELRVIRYPKIERTFLQRVFTELWDDSEARVWKRQKLLLSLLDGLPKLVDSHSLAWYPFRVDWR